MPRGRFLRPCLDCGKLDYGNRCEEHQARFNKPNWPDDSDPARKAKKAVLYNSAYRRRAKLVRQSATTCHLCGGGYREGDPWEADHLSPGNPDSALMPAHRSCNRRKSNRNNLSN